MWRKTKGRNRCHECGRMVELAWCWTASLYAPTTIVWCEQCVERKLGEEPA